VKPFSTLAEVFNQPFNFLNKNIMLSELKAFLMRGNVLDLAVGVIIAGAFGKIVDSLVGDIVSPLIAALSGGGDLSGSFVMGGMKFGSFLQAIINFIIIGIILFMLIKSAQKAGVPSEGPK
jgi:large conductance mechanosensitive channel